MSEEYEILNPDNVEGGIEIPAEVYDAILIVANNIDSIKEIAASIDEDGNISVTAIDGNVSTIKIRRGLSVDLSNSDPVLDLGEFGYPTDLSNPSVLKIGDGATTWNSLPNILLASSVTTDYLDSVIAQTKASADAADVSADAAGTQAGNAAASAASAATNAQTASDWAVAPVSTALPGGKLSAEANADRAANSAALSRQITRALASASEDFTAGMLYTKRRFLGSSNIIVTLYPNTFTSVDDVEAWAVYRKGAAGNIQFLASTAGSNLQAPQLKGHGRAIWRNPTPQSGVNVTQVFAMAIPAVTAGKLVIIARGGSPDSIAKTFTVALSGGLTAITRNAFSHPYQTGSDTLVVDSDLTSFAAATINATVIYGGNVNRLGIEWYVVEGHGAPGTFGNPATAGTANAQVSKTIASVPQGALFIADSDLNADTTAVNFSNMGGNMGVLAQGSSAGQPDATVTNTNANKNTVFGYASAVTTALADFTATATYSAATGRPNIVCFYYPPKTVAGAGTVTLNLMGGRDTLNVLHGEAVLLFHPDGKTITVMTPAA